MVITTKPAVFLRREVDFTGVFLVKPFYTFCGCARAQTRGNMSKIQTATFVVIGAAGNTPDYRRVLKRN